MLKPHVPIRGQSVLVRACADIAIRRRLLNLAYDEKIDRLVYLNADPIADPLRSDPRFAQLMAKIGFH